MITKFTKQNLPRIRALMNVALKDVANQFGVEIDVGPARFTAHETTFKVKLSILNENGDSQQGYDDFVRYGAEYGFDSDDFGRVFTVKHGDFRITGWSRRRHKYPVDAVQISTGTVWRFTPRTVLQSLGKTGTNLPPGWMKQKCS